MSTVRTPPGTTLSTPSPTERPDFDLEGEMAKSRAPIYLIVATSINPPLGIGFRGKLPWGSIPSDMGFFRKATSGKSDPNEGSFKKLQQNKVIMGRKTWDSIPAKFRPLPDRINVVVTRSDVQGISSKILEEMNSKPNRANESTENRFELETDVTTGVMGIKTTKNNNLAVAITNTTSAAVSVDSADTFCIGGAEIYSLLLKDPSIRSRLRILQTQVKKFDDSAFECDTFWPEEIAEGKAGWTEASKEEVETWIGTGLPQASEDWFKDEKAQVYIRVRGWEQSQT